MEPRELLEALVAVVATLGQLAAAVAGPDGDVLLSPRSLHSALGTFIRHLRDTLEQLGDTSPGHLGVTTPGATWARVTAAASAWRGPVAALGDSWARLAQEATQLRDACGDAATAEATAAATAAARAGDLLKRATGLGTAGDNLVAAARRPPLALSEDKVESALAAHEARVAAACEELAAATEAAEEAVVATNRAGAATKRGHRAEAALGPLGSLVAACDEAEAFPRELRRRLGDLEAALEGTGEGSPDVPEAAVAAVAELERLWGAGARLAARHLLGTLGDIRGLLSGRPGGPGVASRCQKATEDIPRLLGAGGGQ